MKAWRYLSDHSIWPQEGGFKVQCCAQGPEYSLPGHGHVRVVKAGAPSGMQVSSGSLYSRVWAEPGLRLTAGWVLWATSLQVPHPTIVSSIPPFSLQASPSQAPEPVCAREVSSCCLGLMHEPGAKGVCGAGSSPSVFPSSALSLPAPFLSHLLELPLASSNHIPGAFESQGEDRAEEVWG